MSDPTRDERTAPPRLLPQDSASNAGEQTAGAPASLSDGDFSFLETPQAKGELGRLGTFRVLKELGRGGMGCVLLAEDTGLERQVALKVMLPRFARDATAKARFLREARAAGKLQHDNVVTIHHIGESNGVPYIAMEFLTGLPLDKYLKEKGDLPLTTVLRIGREIALGLQAAHKLGMIHRDIKPANVWLEAPKGRVKILDFGLARREEDGEAHLTQSGAIVGTPAYMAPEQASGEKIDGRADLFSLGVLLYRLTTGQSAFSGATTTAMLLQVMTHEPNLASEVKPTVPLEMARIIAKLMSKKKEERYDSAGEFLADWEQLMKSPKGDTTQAMAPKPPLVGHASDGDGGEAKRRPSLARPANRWRMMTLLGGCLFATVVAAWFVIPRGTNSPVVLVAKEPPPLNATNAKEVQAAWAAKLKVEAEEKSATGIVMTLIPPGELVKYPYRLGKYEVTQGEWRSVMGNHPSSSSIGPQLPVENVNWYESVAYCNKLSERESLKPYYELQVKARKGESIANADVKILGGPGYHLPTDTEWEHGCRAGTLSTFCFGDDEAMLQAYAWYVENSGKRTHVVGELKPNGFGLHDIHGNVREWNEDLFITATPGKTDCGNRGGGWNSPASQCFVGYWNKYGPANRGPSVGLRLARVPWSDRLAGGPSREK